MRLRSARQAIHDAALAWLAACLALGQFLPPFAAQTMGSSWRVLLAGAAVVLALLAHWALVAVAARRLGRSVPAWLGLSALFPVGSAAALVLLGWLTQEPAGARKPAPAH